MGFVNGSDDTGDRVNSGVMVFGYPVIADIHPADYKANSSFGLLRDRWLYDTVFVNLMKQGVEPYFSFALERTPLQQETGFGGYLALGTLPPVAHGEFVTVPVEATNTIPASFTNGIRKTSELTLSVKAITWNGKTNSTSFQAVVGTGNWQNLFPQEIASQINAAFDPPSVFDPNQGQYPVACNATPPTDIGVQIGGKMFSMNNTDMVWRDWTGACYSSVTAVESSDGIALTFLGDSFLKNVVAIFDVGHDEMRFAQRLEGESSQSSPSPTGPVQPLAGAENTLRMDIGLLFVVAVVFV